MDAESNDGQNHISHDGSAHLNILVAGLGNPILGDDGVGWHVVAQAQDLFSQCAYPLDDARYHVHFECFSLGGISLMEQMIGFDKAILVDAIHLEGASHIGSVYVLTPEELPNLGYGHLNSSHDTTFKDALSMGRKLGADLPSDIIIIGVESAPNFEFSENLSPEIVAALPLATQKVLDYLIAWIKETKL